jgi:hypothetical protein
MEKRKAVSVYELMNKKFRLLPFEGEWLKSFGEPELSGSWLIWGQSGSGKTYLALQLCKYLAQWTRVVYNSLEEGYGPTMQKKLKELDMTNLRRKLILLREPLDDFTERLKKKKSPGVAIIDSLQYAGINYRDYIDLKENFPNKLLIFLSHAEGREPKGNTARSVRYDADVKIYCEGFRAFISSRYGGGESFTIWDDGAKNYWILK